MRRKVITALAAFVTTGGSALADIPVRDQTVKNEREHRDETTSGIADVDKKRGAVSASVTCAMYRPGRKDDPVAAANANPEITGLVRRVAREEGVDESQFLALVYQESRFNPCAKSSAGAIGLSQLMPGTASGLGVNPYSIEDNLRGGARYFKQQLKRFDGNLNLALAAYNSGPLNVQKYGGIPPFKETQGYVANITKKWLPAFGGSDLSGIPLNYGGGSTAYSGLRDSTLDAMATSQATTDSLGNVASWFEQLGNLPTGTVLDSWDQNSGARNANLEMINNMIRLGVTMADLLNSRNAVTASGLSGSSRSDDYPRQEGQPRETTGMCDPRQDLTWDPIEKACVHKREDTSKIQIMLQTD
ncbi:lytic transglycosylase domain-containing protein [Mesorhizobium sp. PL10]